MYSVSPHVISAVGHLLVANEIAQFMKLLDKKDTTIKAELLDTEIVLGDNPFVKEVFYNLESLVITLDPDTSGKTLRVIFDTVRGFRCLDEGDLLDFWANEFIQANWFFEITAGGWLDYEDERGGFISKALGYREFLICGVDDCVSVLAGEPPEFEVEEVALDPES